MNKQKLHGHVYMMTDPYKKDKVDSGKLYRITGWMTELIGLPNGNQLLPYKAKFKLQSRKPGVKMRSALLCQANIHPKVLIYFL